MRRFRRLGLLVTALAVLAACGGGDGSSGDGNHGGAVSTTVPDGASGDGATVEVATFQFAPETISVAPGTTVTWRNRDEIDHTVTSASPDDPFDGALDGKDAEFAHRFEQAGTFAYSCAIHPSMRGTVVVEG